MKLLSKTAVSLTLAGLSMLASGSGSAADFIGTIVNYDQNADVVSNPARLTCIQVQTSPTTTQWGCVYANNRLASRIENTYLQAAVWKKRVVMRGNTFDSDGFLIIRDAEILP